MPRLHIVTLRLGLLKVLMVASIVVLTILATRFSAPDRRRPSRHNREISAPPRSRSSALTELSSRG
jgi:hypothetical protein